MKFGLADAVGIAIVAAVFALCINGHSDEASWVVIGACFAWCLQLWRAHRAEQLERAERITRRRR